MQMHLAARAALLLALVASCGGSRGGAPAGGAATGAGPGSAPELEILDRFQGLATYVEQSGASCPRLATSIESWLEGNAGAVSALVERARAEPGLSETDLRRVEARLERVFDGLLGAVDRCRGHAEVDAAYGRFDAWIKAT